MDPLPGDAGDPGLDPADERGVEATDESGEAIGVTDPEAVLPETEDEIVGADDNKGEAAIFECVRLRGGVSGKG